MPKRGQTTGNLLWCSLTKSELKALDAFIRERNDLMGRIRGKSYSRSRFLAELLAHSLLEWAFPGDSELQPVGETTRVRFRLGWSAGEELAGRIDNENARRQRWGQRAVPAQDVCGGIVRRFLRVQARQRRVEAPAPMAVPAPALAAAAPLMRESERWYREWVAMMDQELARRRAAAEFELLCDDPWCLFFAQNDAIRIGLSMLAVPKGSSPSILKRFGFVAISEWLTPRLRVASGGFRR
jgi:hypothetical protein